MKRLKKNQTAIIVASASLLIIALSFNNCSKVAVLSLDDPAASQSVAPTNPETPVATVEACQAAKAEGRLVTTHLTRNIPARMGCNWGQNGNLSRASVREEDHEWGTIRARAEESVAIEAPAAADGSKAVICNVQISTNRSENFFYDDTMIWTLNGFILASTVNYNQHFASNHGYAIYDWEKFKTVDGKMLPSDSTPDKQYCAGKEQGISSCVLPPTETAGAIELHIGDRVIQTMVGLTNEKSLNLSVITTGDDDDDDCGHDAFDLNLDVESIAR
jgi:hypothetical protein